MRAVLLCVVLCVVLCALVSACATQAPTVVVDDTVAASTDRSDSADSTDSSTPLATPEPPLAAEPGLVPGGTPPVAADVPPVERTFTVEGKPVNPSGLVDVRALELACLADAKALTDTKGVRARFDDVAGKQLVPVGELAFVLLERDPARSMTDPPPLLCRTIASSTVLHAPLVRAREPAARWLVKRIEAGLVADAAALVQQSATHKLELSARPRVIVDEHGSFVAIAVPVGPSLGAGG